jgi:hypothetical protein
LKLYYLTPTGACSFVLNTVQPGTTDDGDDDLFAGMHQPAGMLNPISLIPAVARNARSS